LISTPQFALILELDVLTTGTGYTVTPMNTPERNDQNNFAQGGFQILLGILFLLVIYGMTSFGSRIWLVLGLVPFYWIGLKAYRLYREDGRISNRVVTTLISCLFPFVFIVAIIAGIDMSRLWPIALIIAGATTILTSSR
jgi:accessory gene regulator protein AgrB